MTRKECIDGMQRVIDEDRNKILVRIHVGYLIHAIKYIKDQPEIVLCKDCEHATMTSDGKMCKYCAMDTDDFGNQRDVYHDAEWFCADGERKAE